MKIIRIANLIPTNKNKTKICLVKRHLGDNLHAKWTFPGQTTIKGKTVEESINKIIKEELNTNIINLTKLNLYESKTKNSVIKSTYFVGEIKETTKLNTQKYTELRWFNIDEELFFNDFLYNEKDIISDFIKNNKK